MKEASRSKQWNIIIDILVFSLFILFSLRPLPISAETTHLRTNSVLLAYLPSPIQGSTEVSFLQKQMRLRDSGRQEKGSLRMVSKDEIDASARFCDAILTILESAQHKFKTIRGKLDLVSEEFFGKLVPPGLKECFGWLDGKVYHCRTTAGLSPEAVAEVYERYNRSLNECLPNHWQAKEKNVDRVNARRFMTYESASDPLTIRVGERNKRLGWYVDFYFKR